MATDSFNPQPTGLSFTSESEPRENVHVCPREVIIQICCRRPLQ